MYYKTLSLLQIYKTLWHEIFQGRSLDIDQPGARGFVNSRPGLLAGAEVRSADDNAPQVSNKFHFFGCPSQSRVYWTQNATLVVVVILVVVSSLKCVRLS